MSSFRFYSANPFRNPADKKQQRRTDIGDCVVRALALAFRMNYEAVCRKLGVPFRPGRGLNTNRGIATETVMKAFRQGVWMDYRAEVRQSKMMQDLMSDPDFDMEMADMFGNEDWELDNPTVKHSITVDEWVDEHRGQGEWVLDLEIENDARNGHFTFADTDSGTVYDTWDCRKWRVVGAYRPLKRVKNQELE